MENVVHSIWKEYGNYSMSLLIPGSAILRDTSTRRDLYAFAFLVFDTVINSICIVPSFCFYKRYCFCH